MKAGADATHTNIDIAELLVRKDRINGVLEDKNKNAIMPFTTAEQVEINQATGATSI